MRCAPGGERKYERYRSESQRRRRSAGGNPASDRCAAKVEDGNQVADSEQEQR